MDILQHLVAGFGVALSPTNLLIAAIGLLLIVVAPVFRKKREEVFVEET